MKSSESTIRITYDSSDQNPNMTCGPYSVTFLDQKPVFEWCVIRCGFKIKHHKLTCLENFGLSVVILLSILGSIANIMGGGPTL